jgi:3'(2'), 5'-bisphosphate nucleotidase
VPDHLRLVVSRSRPPAFVSRLVANLDAVEVPMGSAGAKAATVITGGADAYVHSGGQYEWDSAAPVAVALAAGLHASRIDGSPLRYNQPNPSLPDILICPVELAPRLLDAIGAALASDPVPLSFGTTPAHGEQS